jgi:hypothetical protein
MNCETCISLMDDFVDSALPIDERQGMEDHLQTCRNCREELRSLQSLLDRCTSTGESPNRDLWPEIEAGIIGSSQKGETARLKSVPWTWRLAAVAIIGTMLLLAAAYLWHRPTSQVSKTEEEVTNMPGVPSTSTTSDPRSIQDFSSQAVDPKESEVGASAANYAEACQCAPSSKISDLIDRAWNVDPEIPSQNEREIVSNRLFNLATVNGDNFFFHRASIEDPRFPTPVTDKVVQRYSLKLSQQPNDPVWTYLYASSLLGKNTPQMIQTLEQLAAEHPEFPWPNLLLAQIYGLFDYKDETKARFNLQAFMGMCPESPEPARVLVSIGNSEFLKNAIRRMRANLAKSSDLPSLLLYRNLWYLEVVRGASGDEFSNIQQRIREDLKRLQSLDYGWRPPIAQIIASGYFQIGDDKIARDLAEKETSWGGRWATIMLEIREWNEKNPIPAQNAPAEKQAAYWESRLRISNSWINRLPDNPSLLIIKIEAIAALNNRPESELLDLSAKVLALQRAGAITPELGTHLPWKSNILKLASLCADRAIFLNQIPALIEEGYVAAENTSREYLTDFSQNPQWVLLMGKFNAWVEADDAWHKLVATYLRMRKPDKANEALDYFEPRLREFKMLLAQAQANAKPDDSERMASQRQFMADQLSGFEERYASARASIRSANRRLPGIPRK